ncbi:MAG UNVERIFIED_CONTAM: hypothetical protein LVT10_09575 [Anaerolineae bacterium]|jgi:protein-S-isoprenylcysteine O-methyltransferase Ste14
MLENLQKFPLIKWANHHPRLAAWLVLGTGMVAMLAYEARDVGLLFRQWVALIIATVLVAGACVWIISWEDADEQDLRKASDEHPKATEKEHDA